MDKTKPVGGNEVQMMLLPAAANLNCKGEDIFEPIQSII
jgi:hypothetical protein